MTISLRTHVSRTLSSYHGSCEASGYLLCEGTIRGWRAGVTVLQTCTSAIRQLAYGVSPDALDDSLRMAESTKRECLHRFAVAALPAFGERYLRHPNEQDTTQLLAENAA